MSVEPYASARTVYWIVDNGSSHAGNASIARMETQWTNARLIHLPVHPSWLNRIELYFSIVQRKALTPNDFDSLDQFAKRLLRFADHYRQIARPFGWTFSRADSTGCSPGSTPTNHNSPSQRDRTRGRVY